MKEFVPTTSVLHQIEGFREPGGKEVQLRLGQWSTIIHSLRQAGLSSEEALTLAIKTLHIQAVDNPNAKGVIPDQVFNRTDRHGNPVAKRFDDKKFTGLDTF